MIYRHIFIKRSAYQKLRFIAKGTFIKETGGPLVGYITVDNAVVVTDLTGPGPQGKKMLFSVTIDGTHSERFCNQIYEETGGICDYIGDWHCHPSFSTKPSIPDNVAIKDMSEVDGIITQPVSIIYSKLSRQLSAYFWNPEAGLQRLNASIIDD